MFALDLVALSLRA